MSPNLIASRLNASDIFNGCLAVIKYQLTTKLPQDKTWILGKGIQALVGSVTAYNEHPQPWKTESPTWIEIYT